MKLTQKAVSVLSLPVGSREAIFFDDDLPGFGLRIREGGSRNWVYQYKIGSKHRRVTLGSLNAITPLKARERAGELHAMVKLGRDPAGERPKRGLGRPRHSKRLCGRFWHARRVA